MAAVLAVACSPTLDWRESRLDSHGALVLFPCKPHQLERTLRLGDADVRMFMQACEAAGGTYAFASAELQDAGTARAALDEWQRSTADNIAARPVSTATPPVKGLGAADGQSFSMRLDGHTPDGTPVFEHALFAVKGTRIFQSAVVARKWEKAEQDGADTFFEGINLQ